MDSMVKANKKCLVQYVHIFAQRIVKLFFFFCLFRFMGKSCLIVSLLKVLTIILIPSQFSQHWYDKTHIQKVLWSVFCEQIVTCLWSGFKFHEVVQFFFSTGKFSVLPQLRGKCTFDSVPKEWVTSSFVETLKAHLEVEWVGWDAECSAVFHSVFK